MDAAVAQGAGAERVLATRGVLAGREGDGSETERVAWEKQGREKQVGWCKVHFLFFSAFHFFLFVYPMLGSDSLTV